VVGRKFLLVVESSVGALGLDLRLKAEASDPPGCPPLVICDVADLEQA